MSARTCPTTSFPWSWVWDRQKPSLEHNGIYGKDRFPWTGKELLIAEVWVSMPLPSGPSVLRPQLRLYVEDGTSETVPGTGVSPAHHQDPGPGWQPQISSHVFSPILL